MFLSKATNGVCDLFFQDEVGKRRAVSTRHRLKADALKFFQEFKRVELERRTKLQRISRPEFREACLEHYQSIHTAKTFESTRTAFAELERFLGEDPLHMVEVRDIELLLAKKKSDASELGRPNLTT